MGSICLAHTPVQFALQFIQAMPNGSTALESDSIDSIIQAVADAYIEWRTETGRNSPSEVDAAFVEDIMSRAILRLQS